MAVQCFFREHQIAIDLYLKHAPVTRDEFYFRVRVDLLDLGCRTGGPWFVVSNRAVLDRDPHSSSTDGMLLKLGPWANRDHPLHLATIEDQRTRR